MHITPTRKALVDLDGKWNLSGLLSCVWRRLRSTRQSTLFFYLCGVAAMAIWTMPSSIPYEGVTGWTARAVIPMLLIALTLIVAQQISVESASDMLARPVWFLLIMAGATIAAYAVIWLYDQLFGLCLFAWFRSVHAFPVYYRYVIFFVPLGWLSCLYLQRDEDEAKFATLSIKRSMLNREVAQSQLLAARAQIDPKMIERVLSEVQALYQIDADGASRLLDHLIGYLRLAMNRARDKNPSFSIEIALVRSYFSLRKAETGVDVELHASFHGKPAPASGKSPLPILVIARKLFEAAVSGGVAASAMRIDALNESVIFELKIGATRLSCNALMHLRESLSEIPGPATDILHHISESGEHSYVIEIHTAHTRTDSADR